ncbi:DUF1643 domain-containing protein [Nioella nitratireducens]|uniref:DUF1643 domain-containing protein n=1 Tax=Nioella nitratireducens TaxID=1287720 RepID=UPI0008FCE5C6|nr:DUF1643 domain-containing protein [Nioella nitratireducens]
MITRVFQKGDAASDAVYSDCERYRYALTRVWDQAAPRLLVVMLNPSKATEVQNDPTVERCERRARVLGYGGFRVMNIFAWRETDPKLLRQAEQPVGPENNRLLTAGVAWADAVLAGWGVHGDHLGRGPEVEALLRNAGAELLCLGLSKAGHPRHPLYIAYATAPQVWRAR